MDARPGLSAPRLAEEIEAALVPLGTPERASAERAYLKSSLDHLGVPVPTVRRVVRQVADPGLDHGSLEEVVRILWARDVHECRMAAVELLVVHARELAAPDLDLVEELLRTAGTWALVDPLAATVAGGIVERDAAAADRLDGWASDEDLWLRRSALLALLGPIRAGGGDVDRFFRYADTMLDEREFFIRKAIGWVLREMGKQRPGLVAAWLTPRIGRASGVTVREAVKPLDPADRERLSSSRHRPRRD